MAPEWVPDREPVVESVQPHPPQQFVVNPNPDSASVSVPKLAYASEAPVAIPTLVGKTSIPTPKYFFS